MPRLTPSPLVAPACAARSVSGQSDAGTHANPSISRRAVRRVITFSATHSSPRRETTAPTSMTPAGWPTRTVRSPAGPGRAAWCGNVPSTWAATEVQIAPVSAYDRCRRPIDMIRPTRSTRSAVTSLPFVEAYVAGGETQASFGTPGLRVVDSSEFWASPMRTAAAARTASMRDSMAGSPSTRSGISRPVSPRSAGRTKTRGLAASTSETVRRPTPGTSKSSVGWPVGSSRPVIEPPGSRNSSRMRAPVPGTPSMAKVPSTSGSA
jgi:hypothetical protein